MNGCFRVSAKAGGTAGRGWVRTGGSGWVSDNPLPGAKREKQTRLRGSRRTLSRWPSDARDDLLLVGYGPTFRKQDMTTLRASIFALGRLILARLRI